ncbi:MSCRAMM family adhesin SdrC [Halorubellus salinus]|uniref:MSCRAMM family adhesin SdrC n=1 Tax=Halorubellus salinus TaxID=755309 RepID=UPI001D06F3AF|nr:MSCRAMM family adhesin SdrC [Halorubellus salinus]
MSSEVVVPPATALDAAVPLQVEISVQFLAGVAGTILLMLLFLMVVVLWDIALALRDVAEKIDYLEDDVDSDLASINGTLTRIYDRMGGGTPTGREGVSGAGPSAGRESVSGATANVQGTDVVGGSVSASPGSGEPGGVRPGDVRPGRVRAHAAGVNAAAGGTTTVNPTAGGAFDERATPADGRRRVGTAPTAATAGTSTDASEDEESTAAGVGVDSGESTRADGAPAVGTPSAGDVRTGVEEATDAADGAGDGDADDDGSMGEAGNDEDGGGGDENDAGDSDDDGTTADGGTTGSDVEGPATGGDETGPSVDATSRNVGRFASDGSGDPAWYDVTMDVPRTARTDLDDATTDASAAEPTVDERLGSDEVRNAYVDPVSAFGNADDDGDPTVDLDDLGSRFQPTSTDSEADEDAADGPDSSDASGTEPDAPRDDDGEAAVDEAEPATGRADAGTEAVDVEDTVDVEGDDATGDDATGDDATGDDATGDVTADPGTEVVDVETMPSDAGETSGVDTGEDDTGGSEPDESDQGNRETFGADDEFDDANVDAGEDDAESGDAEPAAAAGVDADAVVDDLSAAKARIRERHEDEEGSLDYTSLQREAAVTPGVKGSGMPAEEMLDALAAAAVHGLDDRGDEDAADVDAVEDALVERREATDDESDAAENSEEADGGADDAADDTDDDGIADLVNRELDTLTQEVGGTSMTPDVSDADLDAAVDELDDESYTFPLSGSSFDVTADADAETATLSFTSNEAMDLGGARERLLTYQLRNYLDRDDTTHAELSVDENAVVLEIPAADGPAVNAWADAIVQIIDRTLYLSKDDD